MVLGRAGRRPRPTRCSATPPRPPRWTQHRRRHQERDPQHPVGRRARSDRRRPSSRSRRPDGRPGRFGNAMRLRRPSRQYVDAARRHRQRPQRLHRSRPGSTRPHGQTWSRVFDFGTGTTVNMFLTVQCRRRGTRGSPSPPAAAAGSSGSTAPVAAASDQWTPPRRHAVRDHRHAVRQRRRGRRRTPNMTLHAVEPRQHDQQLDRPLAVRRPVPQRHRRRLPDLRPRADGRGDRRRLAGGTPGAGNVVSVPVRRGERRRPRPTRRATGATATMDRRRARRPTGPGKVFMQRDLAASSAGAVEGPAELLAVHRGSRPEHRQLHARRCATTPTAPSSRSCRPTPRTSATRRRRWPSAAAGSNNFSNINSTLQAQLYARALRDYPTRLHHPGHVPQAARVADLDASTSTATTATRTTTSSSSTGTRPTRRSAARGSTTTSSAPTTS